MDKELTVKGKYDIGLVTFFFANNFGAILTAYGLYKILQNNGYKVLMIDKPAFWWRKFNSKNDISGKFAKKYFELSRVFENKKDLESLNTICDSFIVGSDQMWNYGLYETAGYYTFLDFVDDDKMKLSYATSFGHEHINLNKDTIHKVMCYLNRFNAISTREISGINICKQYFNANAVSNLDAVFFLSKGDYEEIAKDVKPPQKENYLFAYILDGNPDKKKIIEIVVEKLGLDNIVSVDAGNVELGKAKINMDITQPKNVEEWISFIKNSSFVITDSFHGSCFAIIFNKPFICIRNESRGATRFESLFEQLGVLDRMIDSLDELLSDKFDQFFNDINYNSVNKRLNILKEKSLKWLLNELKNKDCKQYITKSEYFRYQLNYPKINKKNYASFAELGLKGIITIESIVQAMPDNSILTQVQGVIGDPILNTPAPYGVLTIIKTTNYFVQITFTQMTIIDQNPKLFLAKWRNGKIESWIDFVTQDEFNKLEKRISIVESKINEEKNEI